MNEINELTDHEIEKVNNIINGIQSDLTEAIKLITQGEFDKSIKLIESGISRSNCPRCKKELGVLIADVEHNKKICMLDEDLCIGEKKEIIANAKHLKDEYVPIMTEKKAIKNKEKLASQETKLKIPEFPVLPFPFFRRT